MAAIASTVLFIVAFRRAESSPLPAPERQPETV
jgi:hypothetical protein